MNENLIGVDGCEIACDLDLPLALGRKPCPIVVILHGFKGFKDWGFFPELAARLAADGLAAVRINFSHNGVGLGNESQGFTRLDLFRKNRASYELRDLQTVVEALEEGTLFPSASPNLDRQRLGFLGHSRGGPIAILAAARRADTPVMTWASVRRLAWSEQQAEVFRSEGKLEIPNARTGQIMTLDRSAFDDLNPLPAELDVDPALKILGARFAGLHGREDRAVALESLESLYAASWQALPTTSIISGADHVMNCRHPFLAATLEFDAAVGLTLAHFNQSL
ncbi:MAG: alpha/beta fold hydrolase [Planctomycetota bacterium]